MTMDTSNFWPLRANRDLPDELKTVLAWLCELGGLKFHYCTLRQCELICQNHPGFHSAATWLRAKVGVLSNQHSNGRKCNKLHHNHKQTKDRTRGLMKNRGFIGAQQAYFTTRIRSQRNPRCHRHFLIFRSLFSSMWPTTITTTITLNAAHSAQSPLSGVGGRCFPAVLSGLTYRSGIWLKTRRPRRPLVACGSPTCSSSSPSGSRRSSAPDAGPSAPWSLLLWMPSDGRLFSTTAETQTHRRCWNTENR